MTRWFLVALLGSTLAVACGGKNSSTTPSPQCSDGIDNDNDGLVDFPDDPGCISSEDDSEDSAPSPQCSDGRDNDGDGKIDYPADPGCFVPQQDDETDDCPSGPSCPACANGQDDDGNGLVDYPNDPGCTAAGDPTEYTQNPVACGGGLTVHQIPATSTDTGTFDANAAFPHVSPCGGGGSGGIVAVAYELHLDVPKVVTLSTAGSSVDTVIDVRSADCQSADSELACNDDASADDTSSSVTTSLQAGTYYVLVESKIGEAGNYALSVQEFPGEGTACTDGSQCGPGLVCRVPMGGTDMVCAQPMCHDGVDDDGDGKADFPEDPGCTDAADNDETDDCPDGPNCPKCGNGQDDDGDGLIDFPDDTSCLSASWTTETCVNTEGITPLVAPSTTGDSTSATDDYATTCAFDTGGPDLTYSLTIPAVSTLSINVEDPDFTLFAYALLAPSCTGSELACEDGSPITQGPLAAGTYFLVVDADFGAGGAFTIDVSGTIAYGGSCEGPLATSGALTCEAGSTCQGTPGSRVCQPAACSDGMDNDGDGKIDYPDDPGCDSPIDDTEADPGTAPACADGTDNDSDGKTDYAQDLSCWAASGSSEAFCGPETDRAGQIYAGTMTGTTTGLHGDFTPSCQADTGAEEALALVLPVPVDTLTIDTNGSSFDTVLTVMNTACGSELICDDDGGTFPQSKVTMSSVAAGTYAVIVDGYSGAGGAFTLHTHGVVAAGTDCASPLFDAGVLSCPAGKTCTGTPKKCQ